jgi:hypothetical protein
MASLIQPLRWLFPLLGKTINPQAFRMYATGGLEDELYGVD